MYFEMEMIMSNRGVFVLRIKHHGVWRREPGDSW